MDEKKLGIVILSILAIGILIVLFIIVPWMAGRGFSNWKENLANDLLIAVAIGVFVYALCMLRKN